MNLDLPNKDPINWLSVGILTLAVTGLSVAVIYAVRSRRDFSTPLPLPAGRVATDNRPPDAVVGATGNAAPPPT